VDYGKARRKTVAQYTRLIAAVGGAFASLMVGSPAAAQGRASSVVVIGARRQVQEAESTDSVDA